MNKAYSKYVYKKSNKHTNVTGVFCFQDLICVAIQAAYLVECIDKETGQTKWQHLFQWLKDDKYEYKIPKTLRFIPDMTLGNKTREIHTIGII